MAANNDILGFGLLTPFQRDGKNDLANGGGLDLVKSRIRNLIGTKLGELRWNPSYGTRLHFILHRNFDEIHRAFATVEIIDALKRWEPAVIVSSVVITQVSGKILIDLTYDVISTNVPGNNVVATGANQTVTV